MTKQPSTPNRGFTLIEILVVIAIVGILASVVMGSVNSARDRGADAAVKTNLRGIQPQAAIFYDLNLKSYAGTCLDSNIVRAVDTAKGAISGVVILGGVGDGECIDSDSAYAVWVNFKHASTSAFCVDSKGNSEVIDAQDSSAVDLTVCP